MKLKASILFLATHTACCLMSYGYGPIQQFYLLGSIVMGPVVLIKTSLMSIALVKAFNYEALLLMGHEAESFYSLVQYSVLYDHKTYSHLWS